MELKETLAELRKAALQLERQVKQEEAARLDRWKEEKPGLKQLIAALGESRILIRKELARMKAEHAVPAAPAPEPSSPTMPPGVKSGFNPIRTTVGPSGQPLSDRALQHEQERLKAAVLRLHGDMASVRACLQQPHRPEERAVWETKLVILQDTARMHQEEAELLGLELQGRQRLAALEAQRRAAEGSGAAQLARLEEQLASLEKRIDSLKLSLYFPSVKGYTFSFGREPVYVGGKDLVVAEVAGSFQLRAEPPAQGTRGGADVARLVFDLGCGPVPLPPPGTKGQRSLPRGQGRQSELAA
eukprot:jgi/Botrbrau1/3865/Bobra.0183s0089.1